MNIQRSVPVIRTVMVKMELIYPALCTCPTIMSQLVRTVARVRVSYIQYINVNLNLEHHLFPKIII